MDEEYSVSVREVKTFMMAFSDTGGVITIAFTVFRILMLQFGDTIYYTSLIRSFYKYQKSSK